MPSKEEKLNRKLIQNEIAKKQKEEFLKTLPMPVSEFRLLFNFLDQELEKCDDTLELTQTFLLRSGYKNVDLITDWLKENGGYCDCEILANVEEIFE